MSAAFEKIKTRLRPDERRKVAVPEWGDADGPMIVHFHAPTLLEISAATSIAKGDAARLNVELVVMKATDAEGKPLFDRIDAAQIMDLPGAGGGIARIAQAMGLINIDPVAAEKN